MVQTINKNINDDRNSIDELFQRSLKFKSSREYLDFFRFLGKVLHYSHYNALLVYMQNPNVIFFGTPAFWKNTFNRTVKPDARPYVIIVPFGPAAFAYDVYETEGEQSPEEFINKGLMGRLCKIRGDLSDELLREIISNLAEYKIYVNHQHFNFNKGGETYRGYDGKIFIKITDAFNTLQEFSTIIHELAHNFLGHLGGFKIDLF